MTELQEKPEIVEHPDRVPVEDPTEIREEYKLYGETIYVLYVDDEPTFYVRDYPTAETRLRQMAREIQSKYPEHTSYVVFPHDNESEIHILGQYKFFVNSFDRTLHILKIHCVNELVRCE